MIVEYDNEDRCIRVNGEYVAIREAEGLMDDLTLAIDQTDMMTTDMEEALIEDLKLLGWHEL